jgi:hypothetical protein
MGGRVRKQVPGWSGGLRPDRYQTPFATWPSSVGVTLPCRRFGVQAIKSALEIRPSSSDDFPTSSSSSPSHLCTAFVAEGYYWAQMQEVTQFILGRVQPWRSVSHPCLNNHGIKSSLGWRREERRRPARHWAEPGGCDAAALLGWSPLRVAPEVAGPPNPGPVHRRPRRIHSGDEVRHTEGLGHNGVKAGGDVCLHISVGAVS